MRRRRPEKRQVLPDPIYNDILVTKFVNYIMECGKKGVAEKIFYGAMETIKQKTKTDGLVIFEKAIENASPSVEVSLEELVVLHTKFQSKFQKKEDFILLLNG